MALKVKTKLPCTLAQKQPEIRQWVRCSVTLRNTRGIHNFRDWCCHIYSSCSSMIQQCMRVLTCLGSQCTKFHAAGWMCWFVMSSYLESWPHEISRWIQQRKSRKNSNIDPAMIRQIVGGRKYEHYTESWTHRDRKGWYRWRTKSRACSSLYLASKGLFTNN
jgi:hypothetical protein